LLQQEYNEASSELQLRRSSYTQSQLESSGLAIFDASATPESELFGEKVVRVSITNSKSSRHDNDDGSIDGSKERKLRDIFKRGDVLLLTPRASFRGKDIEPREGIVMDVSSDFLTLGIGSSWPAGMMEMRKNIDGYRVRLDRVSSTVPLRAQRLALERLRKDDGGSAADLLVNLYYDKVKDLSSSSLSAATEKPSHFSIGHDLESRIIRAMSEATSRTSFQPNQSQREAITWALQRRLSLIRGPPGTGKTRCAALLIATATRMELDVEANDEDTIDTNIQSPPRILAVTHSNGAADVLLQALLQMKVPAVRAGRPASVSPSVQHRTIAALAERMPDAVRLREIARNSTLDEQTRQSAANEVKQVLNDAQISIINSAPVIVTSCIGAQQLMAMINDNTNEADGAALKKELMFPIVVLDEAAQTTEPALISALVAAQARQVIMIGDTKQLPPTVTSQDPELRKTLGVSPMERLLSNGLDEFILTEQYRMPRSLLYHPNKYFYDSVVKCSVKKDLPLLNGFPWPSPNDEPLAFLKVGNGSDEVAHDGGGKSNPTEIRVIIDIITKVLSKGEIQAKDIAIITPYSKQVQLFRKMLSSADISMSASNSKGRIADVQLGTVDSFQGQETDLVIFSAVRSNRMKELGFLRDARRLNVAITRARRGLIVVGDPTVLRTCCHWAALLDSCTERNCVLMLSEYYDHTNEIMIDDTNHTSSLSHLELHTKY
jgi:regulator of nonsense transcripts 1